MTTDLVEPPLDERRRPGLGHHAFDRAQLDRFSPISVGEVELGRGFGSLRMVGGHHPDPTRAQALVLVRLHGEPLGLAALDLRAGDRKTSWTTALIDRLGPAIDAHLRRDGASVAHLDLWNGLPLHRPECQEHRRRVHARGRPASVVIATRERPVELARCLESMLRLDYREYEVVVVDNDPATEQTHDIVRRFADRGRVRYVREPRRGLGAAHNCGIEHARGEIVTFTDDDVVVDAHWLTELVAPFEEDERVAGATGLVLPAELDTPAQLLLESHGRFIKGFSPRSYDLDEHRPHDPLFPFAAGRLGTGANMAFELAYLRQRGGFDAALGTGTPAHGGDDLAALFDVIVSGRRLAYRPGAIVWHHHRRDLPAVVRQTYGYGIGFGAYLASIGYAQPRQILSMLARLPRAAATVVADRRRPSVARAEISRALGDAPSWPRSLTGLQLQGLLVGPIAYARSRRGAPEKPLGSRPAT